MRRFLVLIALTCVCAGGLWAGPVSTAESAPVSNVELRVRAQSDSVWGAIYSVIRYGFSIWLR